MSDKWRVVTAQGAIHGSIGYVDYPTQRLDAVIEKILNREDERGYTLDRIEQESPSRALVIMVRPDGSA